jgi:1-deoxy-D-xylulose-5-phosphate reductoisomerase
MLAAAPSASESNRPPRRLIVLGSTGSIGCNTLEVVEHLNATTHHRFNVVGLAAGSNLKALEQQRQRFPKAQVAIAQEVADGSSTVLDFNGTDAAQQLVEHIDADIVVAAIVGIAGLPSTLAAIKRGHDIALANKETLVAAGEIVMPMLTESGSRILPVDSEHSAIHQCLGQRSDSADIRSTIRRIVLTASGGPFRQVSKQDMDQATPDEALNHPTWEMGPKVTVDSATMMNKALEVIEAHHLFQLPADQIEVLIHPQSVVHGMVEFADHSVVCQMSPPDMKTPIQVALTDPDHLAGCSEQIDFTKAISLQFEPPDRKKFSAIELAYDVIRSGGTAGAVFNAANEAAVSAFLERRIRLGRIVELVRDALEHLGNSPLREISDVHEADRAAREWVEQRLNASTLSMS